MNYIKRKSFQRELWQQTWRDWMVTEPIACLRWQSLVKGLESTVHARLWWSGKEVNQKKKLLKINYYDNILLQFSCN